MALQPRSGQPPDLETMLVDFPTPSQIAAQFEDKRNISSKPYDTAIHWLVSYHHPQQQRQLLHLHQQKLAKFYRESNVQWDSDSYVVNRYSHSRPESLYVTHEMQRNIDAANPADGGNVPLAKTGKQEDKLSINELQHHLANQAARMRKEMTTQYEELRRFQNSELEYWLNIKAKAEQDFRNDVERARIPPIENVKIPRAPPPRSQHPPLQIRPPASSLQRTDSMPMVSPAVRSPIQPLPSPRDSPDFSALRNELNLDPDDRLFASFFLDLDVVQQNWAAIASNWPHYVALIRRKHMGRENFAKAVLEDVLRNNGQKYDINQEKIQQTRERIKRFPYPIARIIMESVLELAEAGIVQFDTSKGNLKGPSFGPNIITNILKLSASGKERQILQAGQQEETMTAEEPATAVGKATDPRQRR